MKSLTILVLLASFSAPSAAEKAVVSPIEKILQQKIIKEGEGEQKIYEEFAEWCEDESKEKQFEIKTGKAEKEKQESIIDKAKSDIEDFSTKIEELSASIGTNEADLKAATLIREKEAKDFAAEEADLSDTIDALSRAKGILEKEMAKID